MTDTPTTTQGQLESEIRRVRGILDALDNGFGHFYRKHVLRDAITKGQSAIYSENHVEMQVALLALKEVKP